jgi:U3 small nucleolar RNA-associated protein 15
MAAPVTSLQPIKLAPGPSPLSPEQTYWQQFKSQQLVPSPSNNPITYISFPASAPGLPLQSPDHFVVTTGTRVQIFSIRSRKLVKTISRFESIAHGAEIRWDGRVMVAGDESGAMQVFDVGSRSILKTWKEHKQPVWVTRFSPTDATSLMSASDDRSVRMWDLPSEASVMSFVGHADYVRTAAFMPGQASGLVVSGSYDQTVKIWDPRAQTASMTFKHAAPVECVLPMPSGTTVLAAADNQISVLDIVAGKPLHVIKNHQKTVTSLCFASKDSRLVSGGLDGHVKVFETTGWNVVSGSKYPSPVLALSVVCAGAARDDMHLVVGMQSGLLSIKTKLSGRQKAREREREKEMQALVEGNIEELDRKNAKKTSSRRKRLVRGQDFAGEGADIVIQGNQRDAAKRLKGWEISLRRAWYAEALDKALMTRDVSTIVTLLVALRHRSGLRTALSGRDEVTLRPILQWLHKSIINPQHVGLCVDVGILILDLYAAQFGQSKDIDFLLHELHNRVRSEVASAQLACQTEGMIGLLMED